MAYDEASSDLNDSSADRLALFNPPWLDMILREAPAHTALIGKNLTTQLLFAFDDGLAKSVTAMRYQFDETKINFKRTQVNHLAFRSKCEEERWKGAPSECPIARRQWSR